eukprot:2851433-Rhodomonas_salina.2
MPEHAVGVWHAGHRPMQQGGAGSRSPHCSSDAARDPCDRSLKLYTWHVLTVAGAVGCCSCRHHRVHRGGSRHILL